jgi:hypothetical protein
LIGYITGLGHLPGLLLHDSPREADMEDALYHRMFDLTAHLEAVFAEAEPSFQYTLARKPAPENGQTRGRGGLPRMLTRGITNA